GDDARTADGSRLSGNEKGEVVGGSLDAEGVRSARAVIDADLARSGPKRILAQGQELLGRAGRRFRVEAHAAGDARLAAAQSGPDLDEGLAVTADGGADKGLAGRCGG